MDRMKTFFIYALLVVGVLLVTDVIMNICLESSYKQIQNYTIQTLSPKIVINEAKSIYSKGYISGAITNDTQSDISNTYIKIDLLSSSNNVLGSEYLKVDNLKQGETKEFELPFKYNNVKSFLISTTNEVVEEEVNLHPLIKKAGIYFTIANFIVWAALPPYYILSAIF